MQGSGSSHPAPFARWATWRGRSSISIGGMSPTRRETLEAFLVADPRNAFARYGLAMELVREQQNEAALQQFALLVAAHPDYTAAYQQAGQLLLSLERREAARAMLEQGLGAALREGNRHAHSEIGGLLQDIESTS